jgi:DNA-binding protein HU-beta
MGKAEMVPRMAEKTDLTHIKAQKVVEAILSETKNVLRHGDSVTLRAFESFQVRDKAARIGRNPKTGTRRASRLTAWFYFDQASRSEMP